MSPINGMAIGTGITNNTLLYDILTTHKEKIIAYNFGHVHSSCNYLDPNTGIYFISQFTAGGNYRVGTALPKGYGYCNPSAAAIKAYPTGQFNFDICIVKNDGSVDRVRWGVKDDEFADV